MAATIFFYLLFVLLSSAYSVSKFYVLAQGLMLVALILFMYKIANLVLNSGDQKILIAISLIYTSIISVSLLGYFLSPGLFATIEAGALRLHGLYNEPAQLAIACGMNIGLVYLTFKNRYFKFLLIIVSSICLVLTGLRTAAVSLIFTVCCIVFLGTWIKREFKILFLTVLVIIVGILLLSNQAIIDPENRYVRLESFKHLSGRTTLWKNAVPIAVKKPFGSGFCLGGSIFTDELSKASLWSRKREKFEIFDHSPAYKTSLHSGFVQALSDLGLMGFIFYLLIFAYGIIFVIKARFKKDLVVFSFMLIFLSITNLAESVIMSPTYTSNVLFWLSWFVLMANSRRPNKFESISLAPEKSHSG